MSRRVTAALAALALAGALAAAGCAREGGSPGVAPARRGGTGTTATPSTALTSTPASVTLTPRRLEALAAAESEAASITARLEALSMPSDEDYRDAEAALY